MSEVPSEAVVVERVGHGPTVLLVHGGASAATTWAGVEGLVERFELAYVHRRGFAPSPDSGRARQDFDVDAADIEALLADGAHLVAHSYGCLGALIAAAELPGAVRSLVLLEPPLDLPAGDPGVAHLRELSELVLGSGLDADPAKLREFLRGAGVQGLDSGPLPPAAARGVLRAQGGRSPFEARPDLAAIRAAAIPALIASGDHMPALEKICDALADAIGGERIVAPGAGHFIAAAPGFATRLERFLAAA